MKRRIFLVLCFVLSSSCFAGTGWVQCVQYGYFYKFTYTSSVSTKLAEAATTHCGTTAYYKWVSTSPYSSSCPFSSAADGYCYKDPWDAIANGTTATVPASYNGDSESSPRCSTGSGYGNQFCRNGYIFACSGGVGVVTIAAVGDTPASSTTCGTGTCASTGSLCRPTLSSGLCAVGEVAIGDGCVCPTGSSYDSSGTCGSTPVAIGGGSSDSGTGSTTGGSSGSTTGGSTGSDTGGSSGSGTTDSSGGSTGSSGSGSGSGSGSSSGSGTGSTSDGSEKATCAVGKVVDSSTCTCPTDSPWNSALSMCGSGTDIGSGTGSVPGNGTGGTGTGNTTGSGSGSGSANGSLLDKWAEGRTAGDAVSDFIGSVKETPLVQGVTDIASLSLSGSCPSFTFSEPYILKVSYDLTQYFCGGMASYIYAAVGLVVVISAVWSAWWIVFVL